MGRPAIECESHVNENDSEQQVSRVPRNTRNSVGRRGDHPPSLRGKTGGPPSKPKYYLMTDSGAVP